MTDATCKRYLYAERPPGTDRGRKRRIGDKDVVSARLEPGLCKTPEDEGERRRPDSAGRRRIAERIASIEEEGRQNSAGSNDTASEHVLVEEGDPYGVATLAKAKVEARPRHAGGRRPGTPPIIETEGMNGLSAENARRQGRAMQALIDPVTDQPR